MMKRRYLEPYVTHDLEKKMILLSGPRQCGKTTFAKQLARRFSTKGKYYYNWDVDEDRSRIKMGQLDPKASIWILDEIHKYRPWRNLLKGIYDEFHEEKQILVTGSARLDLFSRGGDSLQGRYYWWRLHPFSLAELHKTDVSNIKEKLELSDSVPKAAKNNLENLYILGGYPEPFLSGEQREAQRWRLQYGRRVLRDEVRSLESILHIDKVESLFEALPHRVGSPLSINNLKEDVEMSFKNR